MRVRVYILLKIAFSYSMIARMALELGPSWMFHNGKTDLVFLYTDATEFAPVISDTSRNTLHVKFTL